MAITFRSSISNAGNNATINAPTGIQSGDMLVACVYDEVSSGTWTPPSGWTLLDAKQDTSSTAWIHTYYKVAGASEPSSYTWTVPAGSWTSIYIVAFNPGGATASIDVHGAQADTGDASSPNVTTTANGDAVVIFGTNYNGASETSPGSPWTATPNGTYAWYKSGYQIQSSSGSIGAFTFENSAYGLGATVAISASSGGGIVSGSATLVGNSAIAESAQMVAPATLQGNSVIAESAQIAAPANLAGNSVLTDTAQLVTPATLVGNSAISESAQLVTTPAPLIGNAAISEAAQIVAPATIQANSILNASGGSIGQNDLIGNAVLAVTAIILAPATLAANALLAEAAQIVSSPAAVQSNSVLSATGQSQSPSGPGSVTLTDAALGIVTLADADISGSVALSDVSLGTVALSDLVAELVGV